MFYNVKVKKIIKSLQNVQKTLNGRDSSWFAQMGVTVVGLRVFTHSCCRFRYRPSLLPGAVKFRRSRPSSGEALNGRLSLGMMKALEEKGKIRRV